MVVSQSLCKFPKHFFSIKLFPLQNKRRNTFAAGIFPLQNFFQENFPQKNFPSLHFWTTGVLIRSGHNVGNRLALFSARGGAPVVQKCKTAEILHREICTENGKVAFAKITTKKCFYTYNGIFWGSHVRIFGNLSRIKLSPSFRSNICGRL